MYPCIILCGGLATRLGNLASETPKSLLKINSKPFLFYQLRYLEKKGLKKVYLSVGHLSEKFYTFIQDYKFKNISIEVIEDGSTPLGTGGAVKKIIKKIKSPAFVLYGDSFVRINFFDMFVSYKENLGPLMAIYKNNNRYEKSNIYFDDKNIVYRKNSSNERCDHIDYGVGIYRESDFEGTKKSFDLSLIQEKYSKLKKLQYFYAIKRFYEIGTPESYEKAKTFLNIYKDE